MNQSTLPSFIQTIFCLIYGTLTTYGMYKWQQAVDINPTTHIEWWIYLIIPSIILYLLLIIICYEVNVRYAFGVGIDEWFEIICLDALNMRIRTLAIQIVLYGTILMIFTWEPNETAYTIMHLIGIYTACSIGAYSVQSVFHKPLERLEDIIRDKITQRFTKTK